MTRQTITVLVGLIDSNPCIHFCAGALSVLQAGEDIWLPLQKEEPDLFQQIEWHMVEQGMAHNVARVDVIRRYNEDSADLRVTYNAAQEPQV